MTSQQYIDHYLLEKIEGEPVEKRVELLRIFSSVTNNPALAKHCRESAADFERRHNLDKQMRLNLQFRNI